MLCIVQARMGSTRLPGKVLTPLAGRPLLIWLIDRLKDAKYISDIIVATTEDASDDLLVEFCIEQSISCQRGFRNNVARRLAKVATQSGAEEFIRISGDSPLIDSKVVDQAVELYQRNDCDLVTNILTRTFPKGQSVEILKTDTFLQVCQAITTEEEKEHVTRTFYLHPERFNIVSFSSEIDAGREQLSIDTIDDHKLIEKLIEVSNRSPGGWQELLALKRRIDKNYETKY